LVGPVLKWSANLSLGRLFSLVLCLPLFALVPYTAAFISRMVISSVHASQANSTVSEEELEEKELDEIREEYLKLAQKARKEKDRREGKKS
jgi:hypothetical protein